MPQYSRNATLFVIEDLFSLYMEWSKHNNKI